MTTLDKAIRVFGFEDARTITIAVLIEDGRDELADRLYATLVADYQEGEDPTYENEDWDDFEGDADECGFDPYEGCYTMDC